MARKNHESSPVTVLKDLMGRDWKRRQVALEELPAVARSLSLGHLTRISRELKNSDQRKRLACVLILGESGRREAVEPLIDALEDDSRHMPRTAAASLGKLGRVTGVDDLHRIADKLWSYKVSEREAATLAIKKILSVREAVDNSITNMVKGAMNDERDEVRLAGVKAFYGMENREIEDSLIVLLGDVVSSTRQLSALMLKRLKTEKSLLFVSVFKENEEPAIESFREYSHLLESLALSKYIFVRFKAVSILYALDSSKWGSAIKEAADHPEAGIMLRLFAENCNGVIGRAVKSVLEEREIASLEELLNDEESDVRLVAVRRLSEMEHPKAEEMLKVVAHFDYGEVSQLARSVLEKKEMQKNGA